LDCRSGLSGGGAQQAHLEVLVGGAYAFARYTGIERHTKDFDVFVRGRDFERTPRALRTVGYLSEIPFRHWLGKVHHRDYYVDVMIYGAGNGIAQVDNNWVRACAARSCVGRAGAAVPARGDYLVQSAHPGA
jgi:hypothetical protein